ncbi:MAG TPA: hypothetical protein PLX89_25335 [Verrucomicrobiota bacterium]|nr:hypothetical protein [Verrucomicrobiota bacterium]
MLNGDEVSSSEITRFRHGLHVATLTGLSLSNPGALAFYRDLDEVAVFDAHPANFVRDSNGVVLPIDLVLVTADESSQRALKEFLPAGS